MSLKGKTKEEAIAYKLTRFRSFLGSKIKVIWKNLRLLMNIDWKEGEPLPNAEEVEIDLRKFTNYSMEPENPSNQGKWMGFAMIGYPVETPEGRQVATQDIIQQIREILPSMSLECPR